MTRSWWIQIGIAALILIGVLALCQPRYPVVRDSAGETFTVLTANHVASTAGQWTLFKYVAKAKGQFAIAAEQGRLVNDVVENLADQNGDTLLVVQAVYGRYHLGALLDVSRAYTIRYVKVKGHWTNVERF